ncbi:uncharacterized protein LOC141535205 [Cotesia typhae]|uniref:uncharacterized protein LOC141535205 n=1 Tax=Cotesia typhae TaxID=2053667 RepID=UPI003D68E11A
MMKFIVILSIAVIGVIGEEIENKTDDSLIPDSENLIKSSCIGRCPITNTYCDQFCLCLVNYMVIGKCPEGMRFSNSSNDYQVITSDAELILSIFLLEVTSQDHDQDNIETDNHLEMRTKIFWPLIHTTGNCIGKCPPLLEKLSLYANLPHDDCNLYCLCLLGYQMVKQCPDNKHYSESLNQCVDPMEAQCANKFDGCLGNCTLNHDGSSEEIYLPHQNCSQFCKCKSNGRLELHECAENLHFSVENQSCISPEDAKCKVEVNRFNGDNQTEEKQELNTKGCTEECPETNSPNYTVIISHINCSYFCKCNWGKPVVIKCPEFLYFNNKTKTCDSVDNAHCAVNNVNFNQENNKSTSLKENSVVTESTFNEEQNY